MVIYWKKLREARERERGNQAITLGVWLVSPREGRN
jgi:hypothetical protein